MRSLIGALVEPISNLAPVPYTSRRVGGGSGGIAGLFKGRVDRGAQLDAMGSVGTLFSIVNRTSTAVAKVDWHLHLEKPGAVCEYEDCEMKNCQLVTSHAAIDVLNKPNEFFDRAGFFESVQQHIDLTGEGWPLISYDSRFNFPVELWFARPDRMKPVRNPDRFVIGYIYTDPDGVEIPLSLREASLIRMPNPSDPYRGMGPVQALLASIDSLKYSAEWNRRFFLNDATPGGLIEVDKRLSDDEFDEMQARWNETHRGISNANRVGIVEQGKWVDTKFTMRDMQFAELNKISREMIREAFGIGSFMLGLDDIPNRATADTSLTLFDTLATIPRIDRWRGWLNNDFMPLFGVAGRGYSWCYTSPVDDDREAANAERTSKAEAAKAYVEAHYDGESVKVALGLPDELIWLGVPVPPPAAPPASGGDDGSPGDTMPTPDAPPVADSWQRLVGTLTGERRTADLRSPVNADAAPSTPTSRSLSVDELPDISHVAEATDAAIAALSSHWTTIADAQKAELVAQIEQQAQTGSLSDLTALIVDTTAAVAALTAAMIALAGIAGRQVVNEAKAFDVKIDPISPRPAEIEATAGVTSSLLAGELKTTAARAALRANGPSVSATQVADAARTALANLSPASAKTQLGGALHGAVNATRVLTLLGADPVGDLYAHEMNDHHTCQPCGAVSGKLIGHTNDLTAAESLYPAGLFGGYVGCEGGPRCRGTVVAVWHGTQGPQPEPGSELPPVPKAGKPYQLSTEGIAPLVETVRDARAATTKWSKLAGGASSETRLGVLADGRRVVQKTSPKWNDAEDGKHQADAEQLAALVARKLGARTAAVYRDSVNGVWMEWIKGRTVAESEIERGWEAAQEARIASIAGKRLGLVDALTGQYDRNTGNMMIGERNSLVGIDHGAAWLSHALGNEPAASNGFAHYNANQPAWNYARGGEFIDNPLTAGDVNEVRTRLEALRPDFEHIGRGDWLDWSLGMLDQLAPYAKGSRSIL